MDGIRERAQDGSWPRFTGREPVSMNFWGFRPRSSAISRNASPASCATGARIPRRSSTSPPSWMSSSGRAVRRVRVLETPDRWFGVTYREDKEAVVARLQDTRPGGRVPSIPLELSMSSTLPLALLKTIAAQFRDPGGFPGRPALRQRAHQRHLRCRLRPRRHRGALHPPAPQRPHLQGARQAHGERGPCHQPHPPQAGGLRPPGHDPARPDPGEDPGRRGLPSG